MALQKKRPSVKLEDCFLHHDNAAPHVSEYTQRKLTIFGVECLKHPPYSPELAPMDFAIFPEFKSQLRGQRFCSVEGLKQSTAEIIAQYDSNWYSGIFDQKPGMKDVSSTKRVALKRSETSYTTEALKQATS